MMDFNIIAGAAMLAQDKHYKTHAEWIRNMSAKMHASGDLEKPWNGNTKGEPVKAYIEVSSWRAKCPYCGHPEAVEPAEKLFFCFHCNMLENDYEARPVEFPEESLKNQIIATLMERPMKNMGGPTKYERIIRMRPMIAIDLNGKRMGLQRDWWHEQTVDDLRREQDDLIAQWKEQQNGI